MFDFSAYFKDIAVRLKDIAHTDKKRKFHRVSGITQLEELLHNIAQTTDSGFQLVIEDNLDSRFYDNAKTLLDQQYYVFYILKRCNVDDFNALEQAKEGCKSVSKKIWSKLFRDFEADYRNGNLNGLKGFVKGSITIQTVGPLADQYWGLMCSFTVADNPGIKYSEDDWLS